jgi:hypothetical protein
MFLGFEFRAWHLWGRCSVSLRIWNTSFHALLAFRVSHEKPAVILMSLPFYVTCLFSLAASFLFYIFNILTILWWWEVLVCLMFSSLLNLVDHLFPMAWEIVYHFIEYVFYTFSLYLFLLCPWFIGLAFFLIFFSFVCFWWDWGMNSGLAACKIGNVFFFFFFLVVLGFELMA